MNNHNVIPAHQHHEPAKFVCSYCGNVLKPHIFPDGKPKPIRAIAEQSKSKYGRVICPECEKTAADKMKEEKSNVE